MDARCRHVAIAPERFEFAYQDVPDGTSRTNELGPIPKRCAPGNSESQARRGLPNGLTASRPRHIDELDHREMKADFDVLHVLRDMAGKYRFRGFVGSALVSQRNARSSCSPAAVTTQPTGRSSK